MLNAWEDAWRPMVEAAGRDFGDGEVQAAPDAVERGAIRRFVEPLELACPLHVDVAAAAAQGHPDVVAPVSSIASFTIAPMWSPGDPPLFTSADRDAQPARTPLGPRRTGLEPPTTDFFATEMGAEFLGPVHAGRRLHRAGHRLVACVPKETRVGRGAFVTWESETRDETGAAVARHRSTGYSYVRRGCEQPPRPATEAPPLVMPTEPAPVDWSRQRSWDEVAVGDELGPVAFPLPVYRLVMAAAATRDFNAIHHNAEWARATGAPDMYANVVFLQAMWERCVREWIGMGGTIRSIEGFRMTSFNTVGDTVVVRGTVAERWVQEGERWVAIVMRSENRHGVSVGPGTMKVTLP